MSLLSRSSLLRGAVAALAIMAPAMAHASSGAHAPAFLPLGAEASAPRGFVEMCTSNVEPALCSATRPRIGDAAMTTAALSGKPMNGGVPQAEVATDWQVDPAATALPAASTVAVQYGPMAMLPLLPTIDSGLKLAMMMPGSPGSSFWSLPVAASQPVRAAAPVPVMTASEEVSRPLAVAGADEQVSPLGMEDAAARKLLKSVNSFVNGRVWQQTDAQTYGINELWRRSGVGPNARGDCEDLAIEKRMELLARGFPADRLAFAVVYSQASGLHTVLIARADSGDFVLDSRSPYVQPWSEVRYSWIGIQSMNDPMVWRALGSAPNAV